MKSSWVVQWLGSWGIGLLVGCGVMVTPTPTISPTLTPAPIIEPQTLARSVPNGIVSFAMDEVNLYWSTCRYSGGNVGRGGVFKIAKTGGAVVTLASDQVCPRRIAVDTANVYWINEGEPDASGYYRAGTLMQIAKTNGPPIVLASQIDGHASIAIDAMDVYWSDCFIGAIKRIAKGGVLDVVRDAHCPISLGVDETNLYWLTRDDLRKIDKRGGAVQTLATGGGSALLLDTASLYWTRTEQASRTTFRSCADERSVLLKTSKAGDAPVQLASIGGLAPDNLAQDANAIYWSTDCMNGIGRVPKNGGAASVAIENQNARFVLTDEKNFYWVTYAEGVVMKQAK